MPEDPKRGEDRNDLVFMREVGVEGAIEREGERRRVERSVCLGMVFNGGVGEAGEKLVDIAHTLDASELVAVSAESRLGERGSGLRQHGSVCA